MAVNKISNLSGNPKKLEFNIESCETILEVAKDLYQDELERYKQIESKTAITLAFIGVIITFLVSSFMFNETALLMNVKVNTIFFCFDIGIMAGFIASIIYLLNSIVTSDFQQVKIDEIVNIKDATSNPAQVKIDIAATYQNIVNHNMGVINEKAEKYTNGIILAKYSFIAFSISLLLQGVIRYVS